MGNKNCLRWDSYRYSACQKKSIASFVGVCPDRFFTGLYHGTKGTTIKL